MTYQYSYAQKPTILQRQYMNPLIFLLTLLILAAAVAALVGWFALPAFPFSGERQTFLSQAQRIIEAVSVGNGRFLLRLEPQAYSIFFIPFIAGLTAVDTLITLLRRRPPRRFFWFVLVIGALFGMSFYWFEAAVGGGFALGEVLEVAFQFPATGFGLCFIGLGSVVILSVLAFIIAIATGSYYRRMPAIVVMQGGYPQPVPYSQQGNYPPPYGGYAPPPAYPQQQGGWSGIDVTPQPPANAPSGLFNLPTDDDSPIKPDRGSAL